MSILDSMDRCRRLWSIALPDVEAPEDRQFLRWLDGFGEAAVEQALLRTGRRFARERHGGMTDTAADTHRYCTGVMVNQARAKKPCAAVSLEIL